jgi:DNA repair exonuclease SbcCD nuclease subunit
MTGEDDIVLKLLHTADWHLGRRFRAFAEEDARRLARARLEVLERILGEAERNQVHAVLCAGDLFDDVQPTREWWGPMAEAFARRAWKDRPVFLLPGNHDPLLADSIWKHAPFRAALPDFVHVVEDELLQAPLANGAVLYAVPCQSKAGQGDPTLKIPVRERGDERVRVGLVHGSTFDLEGWQTNFPISKDAAVTRGLDYLAIGDTHSFRFVPADRLVPPTIYPGAPEPTSFGEDDAGHVAVVFINRARRALVQKQRVAKWRWEAVHVTSMDGLRALASRTDLGERVMRVTVELRVGADEYEEAEDLLEQLQGTDAKHGRAGVLALDREALELDVTDVEAQAQALPEVLQATVRALKAATDDPERRVAAQRALFHLFRAARAGTP